MSEFHLTYPIENNQQESKVINSGELLFLVGANGAGKSTLMQKFASQNSGKVRRITAHRQVWFNSNTIDLTPASREQSEKNITSQDKQVAARWRDDYAAQRSQVTIFDLIDSENVEARKIADAARAGKMDEVESLASTQSPMAKMNDILKISNLDIQITVDQGSKLLAVRGNSPAYSIAELSDGERNAIIIIANILTAPDNTLILLDEPERHLHRSIVSPLISTLLAYREDCAFVISTHDVSLPLDQNKVSALLARSYSHAPQYWAIDYIPSVEDMDENTAKAVLGSRRIIFFTEGLPSSLDLQIYQILFPTVSIRPVGSCVEVERIVKGLISADGNHWISAVGIIDRDNRSDVECAKLTQSGIVPIEQYSVESIYYHPITINSVLKRVALINDINVEETVSAMNSSLLASFEPHRDRMAARIVERKARDYLLHQAPDWKAILRGDISIDYSTESLLTEEKAYIDQLIKGMDIAKIVSRYPIRETPALESVSNALGFPSQERYEQAVRKMLVDCADSRELVLGLLSPVTNHLATLDQD
jgi:ATPase components of ABC transporters with duplicated ATPase domains